MSEMTEIFDAIRQGDAQASARLFPLVYDELRRMARDQMARERAAHTLQPTALVHEAFLRLMKDVPTQWEGRAHFFSAAAEAMRRILVEHARSRQALKRGGANARVELSDEPAAIFSPEGADELLMLDEALTRFEQADAHKAKLVKLLYFGGLNLDEAAAALEISRTTAHRQWVFARAWLYESMGGADPDAAQRERDGSSGL